MAAHNPRADKPASRQIDDIIALHSDWRGQTLAELRAVILSADPDAIEEVKWKKPSRPEGVPVWMHDGNVCIADTLKNAVRLTFPNGALVEDPKGLFNARLDSRLIRAIDFFEGVGLDETALKTIVTQAVAVNVDHAKAR